MSDDNIIKVDFGRGKIEGEEGEQDALLDEAVDEESEHKYQIFKQLLEEGTVLVVFDARPDSVSVPEQFKTLPNLSLNFDYRFNISDFEFDVKGVRASLSFNGVNHWCDIPWSVVFALKQEATSTIQVFEDSIPDELK